MKMKWFATAALVATFAVPAAYSQVGIYIGRRPPPMRYERRPPMPGQGYMWIDGYWGVSHNRYVWMPGRWNRPPYEGAYWNHPHYEHSRRGWQYHEGGWGHEDRGHHNGDHHGHDDHHDGHGHR